MPTLEWIGKDKVINHHQDVPYRVLERQYRGQPLARRGQHEPVHGDVESVVKQFQ